MQPLLKHFTLAIWMLSLSTAVAHEWTLPDGSKVEAEAKYFNYGELTLVMKDGKRKKLRDVEIAHNDLVYLVNDSSIKSRFERGGLLSKHDRKPIRYFGHSKKLLFSPDGKYLVVMHSSRFKVLELATEEFVFDSIDLYSSNRGDIISFSHDGKTFYQTSTQPSGHVRYQFNEDGTMDSIFRGDHKSLDNAIDVVAAADNKHLVVFANDRKHFSLIDINSGEVVQITETDKITPIEYAYVNPGGTQLVTFQNTWLKLFDLKTGRPIQQTKLQEKARSPLVISGDGSTVFATVYQEGFQRAMGWSLRTGLSVSRCDVTNADGSGIKKIWLSHDGSLAAVQRSAFLDICETRLGTVVAQVHTAKNTPVQSLAVSRDNRWLAFYTVGRNYIRVFDLQSAKQDFQANQSE